MSGIRKLPANGKELSGVAANFAATPQRFAGQSERKPKAGYIPPAYPAYGIGFCSTFIPPSRCRFLCCIAQFFVNRHIYEGQLFLPFIILRKFIRIYISHDRLWLITFAPFHYIIFRRIICSIIYIRCGRKSFAIISRNTKSF